MRARFWSLFACCLLLTGVAALAPGWAIAQDASPVATPVAAPAATPDLMPTEARVRHLASMNLLVFEMDVEGTAGGTVPAARGQLDGAPVLAYVFPTTLPPESAGFSSTEGILALAVTVHPDFDDTPLWDENMDGIYDNDGVVYHTHWVVLTQDDRVAGGFSVKEYAPADGVVLPPTNPGMPMFMDSPGFTVNTSGQTLQVLVPVERVSGETAFSFDGLTSYLEVNTSDPNRPMLGVYAVYAVLSGDLSLPYTVTEE